MAKLQTTVRFVMLAVASVGATPLWLHQAVHHCETHVADDRQVTGGHSHCGHLHLSADDPQPVDFLSFHSHGGHDCWTCYQLAQSQQIDGHVSQATSALPPGFAASVRAPVYGNSIEGPPPARGPPALA